MTHTRRFVLHAYELMLFLYPSSFRKRFAEEMNAAAWYQAQEPVSTARLSASLFSDLLRSLPRTHWNNPAPARFAVIMLCVMGTQLVLQTVFHQQQFRRAADYMPGEMTRQYAQAVTNPTCATYAPGCTAWYAHLLSSERPQQIESPAWLRSGLAFVAVYDDSGQVLGANARLNGALPQPPRGIFSTIRQRGEYRVTWQPQSGIRVALTGRPLPSGGFVLSGDSLYQSEAGYRRFLQTQQPDVLILIGLALVAAVRGMRARHLRLAAAGPS